MIFNRDGRKLTQFNESIRKDCVIVMCNALKSVQFEKKTTQSRWECVCCKNPMYFSSLLDIQSGD